MPELDKLYSSEFEQQFKTLLTGFNKLNTDLSSTAKGLSKLDTSLKGVTKSRENLNKTAIDAEKLKQEAAKTDNLLIKKEQEITKAKALHLKKIQEIKKARQEQLKIQKQKLDIDIKEKKEVERLTKAKERETAQAKKATEAAKKQNRAYVQLSQKYTLAANKAKDLAVQYGVNSKQARRAAKEARKYGNQLKKIDARVGQHSRSVGGYFKSMLKGAVALGAGYLGVQSVIRLFGSSIKTIAGFEASMDKVKAVSGATGNEFKALVENAKLLGQTTSRSAQQVSGLQLEFSKLGFSTKEILQATEATISLSIAAGSDLAESAVVAASTVRGFGLSAKETQRIVDVMAKSFSSSALDLEKFKTTMAIVAPVAKSAGKDIEFVTAQMSVLSDAGIDASTSGTSLRNMFLELTKKGLTWEEGLQKINDSTNKAKTGLELFGKRGVTAALVLAENIDKAEGLEKSYDRAAGSAKKMARIMEDNLLGDTKKLSSAWEGWILNSNTGIIKLGRSLVQFATKTLGLLNDKTEERIDLTKLDNREMNLSFNALKDVNLSQEARIMLIGEINTEYGEYLPNLLNEKSSIDDITKAQEAANKQFRVKIIQQAFEEEMTEVIKKETQAYEELAVAQIDNAKTSQEIIFATDAAELAGLERDIRGAKLREDFSKTVIDNNEKEVENTRDKFKKIAELYNIAFSEIEKVLNSSAAVEEKVIDEKAKKQKEKVTGLSKERMSQIRAEARENLEINEMVQDSVDETNDKLEEAYQQNIDNEKKLTQLNKEEKEQRIEDDKEYAQLKKDLNQEIFNQGVNLANNLFSLQQAKLNAEASEIEDNFDRRIAAAEGNDSEQKRLERQKAEALYSVELQLAKSQKQQALLNIAVSTAQGIASAWASSAAFGPAGPAIAIGLTGLLVANAAVQVATINATPLPKPPQFDKGTKSAPTGGFIAGEKRGEFMSHKGKLSYVDKPTFFGDEYAGAEIIGGAKSARIIDDMQKQMMGDSSLQGGFSDTKQMESKLDMIVSAIEHNTPSFNIHKNGMFEVTRQRHKQIIRNRNKFQS